MRAALSSPGTVVKALLLCLLAALVVSSVAAAEHGDDPGDTLLEAHLLRQKGEKLESSNSPVEALQSYREEDKLLKLVQQKHPNWHPAIVASRVRRVAGAIARLTTTHQRARGQNLNESTLPRKAPGIFPYKHQTFTFVRIKYSSHRGGHRASKWATDYPDADLNFTSRFQAETGILCEPQGRVMELTDPALRQFPFIYIAEGGAIHLSDAEVLSLRQYLMNGGFLMVDDFWGEAEWTSLAAEMKRVFPDQEPVELPIIHPLFHCYYEMTEKPQVPSVAYGTESQFTGITWEKDDARVPHYRGLVDGNGRLMAILCHNTDLADGWEREGVNPYYFEEFSQKRAYPMGINIVVYALTR